MLIQAEAGVASVTGGPEAPARVGVSVCDIGAGMNAYEAMLEALIARGRTGEGAAISVSMFDAMADWMATPLLQHEGGAPPKRIGLAHTSIAPYGVFKTRDGADILISIQSDREWRVLAEKVLGDKALAADPDFATNIERVKRRAETDGRVAAVFAAHDVEPLIGKARPPPTSPSAASTAPAELAQHPHLRRITIGSPTGPISYPAPAAQRAGEPRRYGPVPALGEHSDRIRAEFGAVATSADQARAPAPRRRACASAVRVRADEQHERHREQREDHQQLEVVLVGDHRRLLGHHGVEQGAALVGRGIQISGPAWRSASLNGVMCSASRACISLVLLVRKAIAIEMPIAEPRLRISVSDARCRWCADAPGRVANDTVLSDTNTRPMPMPWMMPVTTIMLVEVFVVKPIIT